MEVTLGAGTLIPLGSLGAFVAAVWYLSTKVSDIVNLKAEADSAKKALELRAHQVDFEKHVNDDAQHHAGMMKEIADIKLVQARDGERWISVEKILQSMQDDLKKALNR